MRRPILVLAFLVTACASGRTTSEVVQTVAPTPNVQATVEAAVKATTQAVAVPTERPTMTSDLATRAASIDATTTARPAVSTVAPTVAPSATPRPVVKLEVTQFNHYVSGNQYTYVQGLVENKGTITAGGIEIVASLLNDAGATVGTGSAFIEKPSILEPGARGAWLMQISGTPTFKEIKVQIQAEPQTGRFTLRTPYRDIKLEGVTVAPPGPPYNVAKVTGQVVNSGAKVVDRVRIQIAIYEDDGTLLSVASTYPKLDQIPPGGAAPFEFGDFDFPRREKMKGRPLEKYDLFIEAYAQ